MNNKKSLAERFDEWRVFTRVMVVLFCLLMWYTHEWYVGLEDPTTQQTTYAGGMIAAAAGFFKFYIESRKGTKIEQG